MTGQKEYAWHIHWRRDRKLARGAVWNPLSSRQRIISATGERMRGHHGSEVPVHAEGQMFRVAIMPKAQTKRIANGHNVASVWVACQKIMVHLK